MNISKPNTYVYPSNMQINTLEHTPLLFNLLTEYVSGMYEECAILDEEHLLAEYHYLLKNNKLHELFEWEYFQNQLKFSYNNHI